MAANRRCVRQSSTFFARQKGPMSLFIRTIGIARATTKIGLANLTYNMHRLIWLTARKALI
jgi:hypothetical protein